MNKKLNLLIFSLCLTITILVNLSIVKAQNTQTEKEPNETGNNFFQDIFIQRENSPPVNRKDSMSQKNENNTNDNWNNVFKDVFNQREKDPPVRRKDGTTRSGNLCLISPGLIEEKAITWNTIPTFIWQGNLNRIEIRPTNSEDVLWSVKLENNQQVVIYDGDKLKPGETYYWTIYDSSVDESSFPTMVETFIIMDIEKREVITQELEKLDATLNKKGATPEEIAMARVKYFAERNLFSDALSTAFSVEQPSQELLDFRNDIIEYFCGISNEN
ncbi:MAG: hypothetical protein AB4080_01095 [Trichodesmium sp.]